MRKNGYLNFQTRSQPVKLSKSGRGHPRPCRLNMSPMTNQATVQRIAPPSQMPEPQDPLWQPAEILAINQFRPEGSAHRPLTSLRLLHDNHAIYGLFRVQDQYVRCRHGAYGDPVYQDSCVEFFARPKPDAGYFNFEFNCGGAFLCNYITDETKVAGGFRESVRLSADEVKSVRVATSLPSVVEPEIGQPVSWWLIFAIPVPALEQFVGPVGALSGQTWRANAFKCGDETSHPHWASWTPLDERNFHLPRCFGELTFA